MQDFEIKIRKKLFNTKMGWFGVKELLEPAGNIKDRIFHDGKECGDVGILDAYEPKDGIEKVGGHHQSERDTRLCQESDQQK